MIGTGCFLGQGFPNVCVSLLEVLMCLLVFPLSGERGYAIILMDCQTRTLMFAPSPPLTPLLFVLENRNYVLSVA